MASLRLNLLISILVATSVTWAIAAFNSYQDTRKEVDRLFDAHLTESAAALLKQATHEWRERELRGNENPAENRKPLDVNRGDIEDNASANDDDHAGSDYGISELQERGDLLEKRLVFEFWDKNGQLLLRAGNELKGINASEGFSNYHVGPVNLRIFSQWNSDHSLRVVVAESVEARLNMAQAAVANIIRPLLWVLVPLILLLVLIIEWTLKPIRLLAAEVRARTANDLHAIGTVSVPDELKPIVQSLNSLFARLARAIENERRFTADAAHELRTPLAAIKVQAQVAQREKNDGARNKALEATIAGVDRATRLVEQLLTLARLDPEAVVAMEQVPFQEVVGCVLSEMAPLAVARSVEIEFDEGGESFVAGQRQMLEILVRNLLDNAIRYTPPKGQVHVVTKKIEGAIIFVVADTGPGLSERQKISLGQRFSRVDRPSGEGSGLGLSIVMKIAAIHRAEVTFENKDPGPGLTATVSFGVSS